MEPIILHMDLDFLSFSATPNYMNKNLIQNIQIPQEMWVRDEVTYWELMTD